MDCFVKVENLESSDHNCMTDNFILDFFSDSFTQERSLNRQCIKIEESVSIKDNQRADKKPEPIKKIIKQLESILDIRTSHKEEILTTVQKYFDLKGVNENKLSKKIFKRKLKLKREKAKTRPQEKKGLKEQIEVLSGNQKIDQCSPIDVENFVVNMKSRQQIVLQEEDISHKNYCSVLTEAKNEDQSEKKKKRNRVSAQVSRDRKKQYIQELEMKNQELNQRMNAIQQEIFQLRKFKQQEESQKVDDKGIQLQKEREENLQLKMELQLQKDLNEQISSDNQLLKEKLMRFQSAYSHHCDMMTCDGKKRGLLQLINDHAKYYI